MLIPVLISPFSGCGNIHVESFERLGKRLIQGGASEFWLFGTGGEDWCLSHQKRYDLLKGSKFCLDRKESLIIGLGNLDFQDAIDLAKRLLDLGYRRFHFIQPNRALSLSWVFNQLMQLTQLSEDARIWGYFSNNFSRDLSYGNLKDLGIDISRLEGLKISTSDLASLYMISQEYKPRILPAKAAQILPTLELGFREMTSVEGCLHLAILNNIIKCHEHREKQQAKKEFQEYLHRTKCLSTTSRINNFVNIAEIKYVLYRQSVIDSYQVSADLMPLSEADRSQLDRHLDLGLLS